MRTQSITPVKPIIPRDVKISIMLKLPRVTLITNNPMPAKNTLHVDHVDVKTMLYTWLRHSPLDEVPYTDFNQTLKAFGTDETALQDIIKLTKGKIKLINFMDRGSLELDGMEPLLATTVIDAVHLALRAYTRGGVTQAKQGIDNSPFGSEPIINTIEALAKISATKTDYEEGKVCLRFIRDWNELHGTPQPTQLGDYFKSSEKEQTKLDKVKDK